MRIARGLVTIALFSLSLQLGCGDGDASLASSKGAGPPAAGSDPGAGDGPVGVASSSLVGQCTSYFPNRQVFWGDFHVHTDYSADAYSFGTRLGPDDAYAFAKGAQVQTYGGATLKLHRPLDFIAVTDHSESFSVEAGTRANAWQHEQQAAADALDTTAACTFTSFVGYEWSGKTADGTWWHRNVIFRNNKVPALPINSNDATTPKALWTALDTQCTNAGTGCEAIVIPHNTNYSKGYSLYIDDTITAQEATKRARFERLAEIYQTKGNSECQPGNDTNDPLCNFEQLFSGSPCATETPGQAGCEAPLSYVRNALKKGLRVEENIGVNPLKFGIIASSDTHNATPGSTDEDNFQGHASNKDADPQDRLTTDKLKGAGGLVAVWAEENSRDAIFDALQRRETYGTSGTRIRLRFFGGWGYTSSICGVSNFGSAGYAGGVPMGSDLPSKPGGATAPTFAVLAVKDAGTTAHPGSLLQQVQIIKGWVDPTTGKSFEKVYQVAGDPNNGATVDTATCEPSGPGNDKLCTAWTDPDFDPAQRAFYYARAIENPSCRHSAYDCNSIPAANRPAGCTNGGVVLKQRERAWSSPIWYRPGS